MQACGRPRLRRYAPEAAAPGDDRFSRAGRSRDGPDGSGRITGTVRDADAALVPGAAITVVNERTGRPGPPLPRTKELLRLRSLPSRYTVQAALSGFATTERKGVQLLSGQESRSTSR